MSKKDIYETILGEMSSLLDTNNFKALKKESCLIRKTLSGNDKINFAVYDNFNQYSLGVVFTKRVEEAEKIFHLSSLTDKKYQDQSWTIHLPLYFFDETIGSVNFKFPVNTLSDLNAISKNLASLCHSKVIPLLDELEDGHNLYSFLWSLIEKNLISANMESNYAHGLILSHLYAPQDLAGHIAFVEDKLSNFVSLSQSRLTNLINYLRQ